MRRRAFCGLLGLAAWGAATARGWEDPAATPALPDTAARIVLRVPQGAKITANDKGYGTKREIDYPGLQPGKTYAVQVRVKFAEGGEARRLALIVGGKATEVAAALPSRIVFSSSHDTGLSQIFSIHTDGKELKRLTDVNGNAQNPRLSPDGSQVLFEAGGDLYTVSAEGGQEKELTSGEENGVQGDWSPDGSRIAFVRGRALFGGGGKAFVMRADGTGAEELADKRQKKQWLRWSPDGRELAFLAVRLGEKEDFISFQDIFVMKADGTNIRQLTNRLWGCHTPAWSPDGSRIVFAAAGASTAQGGRGLFVMPARGGAARRLTVGEDYCPAWSPDGTQIAFQRESAPMGMGSHNLFVINADGTGLTQLTRLEKSLGTPGGVDWH